MVPGRIWHLVLKSNQMQEMTMSEVEQINGALSFSLFGGTLYILENGWLIGWEKSF